jgi:ketosteroid isomerase-like protein
VASDHPNAIALARFYEAFNVCDAPTMVALYAPDAVFSDPAFGELHGPEVGAMWTMLTGQATDLRVQASDIEADDDSGSAHWQAHYTFSATGRPVVNNVTAQFRFRDGLIVEHRDRFSMWTWSRQALGPSAYLLGWNPIGHGLVQRKARGRLEAFMARDGAAA